MIIASVISAISEPCHDKTNRMSVRRPIIAIGTASAKSANSVESDHGCTSRIYIEHVSIVRKMKRPLTLKALDM